uniref:Uncharacterized protein n=1 Tax=Globodera rostochiensis TaxID=31243 RepID=A0A914GW48_GLORO
MRLDFLERALSRCFSAHIRIVTLRPAPFLLLPLISSALLSIGLLRLLDALVKDELELYTSTDARARGELRELATLFHINDTDLFYASRRYDLRRMGYIIVTGVDGEILNSTTLKVAHHRSRRAC